MSPLAFRLLPAVLIAGLLLPMPAPAQSQYPNQPIKLIVPYAPGGVPDTTARLLARFPNAHLADPEFVPVYGGSVGELRLQSLPMLTH